MDTCRGGAPPGHPSPAGRTRYCRPKLTSSLEALSADSVDMRGGQSTSPTPYLRVGPGPPQTGCGLLARYGLATRPWLAGPPLSGPTCPPAGRYDWTWDPYSFPRSRIPGTEAGVSGSGPPQARPLSGCTQNGRGVPGVLEDPLTPSFSGSLTSDRWCSSFVSPDTSLAPPPTLYSLKWALR